MTERGQKVRHGRADVAGQASQPFITEAIMKRSAIVAMATIIFVTVSAIELTAAQVIRDAHKRQARYKMIDLGTFGGPMSADFAAPLINNHGVVTGAADTAEADPNAPNCYDPDCFVTHAYKWHSGVLLDLGTLPSGFGSEGNWINDHGQIAGQSLNGQIDPLVGTPAGIAVFWKKNGQIVDLGTLGGNESLSAAINNRGQIVGAATNSIPDPFPGPLGFWGTQTRAFLWERGFMRDLGDLGGPDSFAIFVNERSQIAGVSYTSSTPSPAQTQCGQDIPPQHPFLWENGEIRDLGTLGGICALVFGLNNTGEVIGQSDLAGDSTAHPFLWKPERRPHLRDLGTLGGSFGAATWLNDARQIVGVAATPHDEAFHAFFWRNGVMKDLGTVKGDGCSVAYHINAKGQVVGTSGDGCNEVHGFLWERGCPIMDLNDLVASDSGMILTAGEWINDRGDIGASGIFPNGDHHAILLIPQTELRCHERAENDRSDGADIITVRQQDSPTPPTLNLNHVLARIRHRLERRYRPLNNFRKPTK
jgi:probable HAF family extracellular repeat protein